MVAADIPVPRDASDFRARGVLLGCNRLVCGQCGVVVRQHPGVQCPDVRHHLDALAAAPDWSALPFVEPFGLARLYACRCTGWLETSFHACGDPDPDPSAGDPSLPWACGGHPDPVLPIEVDGVTLDTQTDLDALVARILGGWSPDDAPSPCRWSPSAFLSRVRTRLSGTPLADPLGAAVGRRLADLACRGGVLAYYASHPRDPGLTEVLALATDPAELHRDHATRPKEGEPWWYAARIVLRSRLFSMGPTPDALDDRAAQLLRDALLRGDRALTTEELDAVCHHDAGWVAANAVAIVRARSDLAVPVLDALVLRQREDLVAQAGVGLARDPAADVVALRRWTRDGNHRYNAYAVVISAALGAP